MEVERVNNRFPLNFFCFHSWWRTCDRALKWRQHNVWLKVFHHPTFHDTTVFITSVPVVVLCFLISKEKVLTLIGWRPSANSFLFLEHKTTSSLLFPHKKKLTMNLTAEVRSPGHQFRSSANKQKERNEWKKTPHCTKLLCTWYLLCYYDCS